MERRTVTLLFAVLASLSAGTNYLYSTYSPQLAARLALSSTQSNVVGVAANLGVYLSGPLVGSVVDWRGPRMVLSGGGLAILVGYLSIRAIYDGGIGAVGIYGLIAAEALTGIGSCCALSSSTNAVAKSFEVETRGGYLSLVMSAFGISAAFFSSLSHLPFLDDTSSLLLLLALWTSTSLLLGAVFIRPPVETPGEVPEGYKAVEVNEVDSPVVDSRPIVHKEEEGVSGIALFKERDFQLLWSVMFLLSGTGLMYINNVGTMAQSLSTAEASPIPLATIQAHLVTVLSIFNCGGRLFSGFTSDYFAHRAHGSIRFPRLVWLSIIAIGFILSGITTINTRSLEGLFWPTAMTGLSYGALFGVMPVLCLEAHGVRSFSKNNGLLSLAPAVGGNLVNIAFGRIYDSHVPVPDFSPFPSSSPTTNTTSLFTRVTGARDSSKLCVLGPQCYVEVFYLTIGMNSLALVLAIIAAIRQKEAVKRRRDSDVRVEI